MNFGLWIFTDRLSASSECDTDGLETATRCFVAFTADFVAAAKSRRLWHLAPGGGNGAQADDAERLIIQLLEEEKPL